MHARARARLCAEVQAARNTLTVEELQARVAELEATSGALDARLAEARASGAARISANDVAHAERSLQLMMDAWAKYRRIFRNVWDTVAENLEGKEVRRSGQVQRCGAEVGWAANERGQTCSRCHDCRRTCSRRWAWRPTRTWA